MSSTPLETVVVDGLALAKVIDVGVNEVDGELVGDVDTEGVLGIARIVTPHRRGVGPMTITMLLHNTLKAYEARLGA